MEVSAIRSVHEVSLYMELHSLTRITAIKIILSIASSKELAKKSRGFTWRARLMKSVDSVTAFYSLAS